MMSARKHPSQFIKKRPTIGWFTNNLRDIQQITFWQHLGRAARCAGVDIICYASDVETFAARIVQQASRGPTTMAQARVDAIIVPDVALRYISFLEKFIQTEFMKPAVSVMYPLKGRSAVLLDNEHGIRLLMTHLIETHGYRKIGFIGLNTASFNDLERFHAYQTLLAEYDMPSSSDIVEPDGYHLCEQGYTASVGLLFDKRNLKPGVDIEALVCSNDWTAIHVIKALHARGLRVPEDIAVVGCDDLAHEQQVLPRLTTAHLSLETVAFRALELALAQIKGDATPKTVLIPFGDLIVRESCGCASICEDDSQSGEIANFKSLVHQFNAVIKVGDLNTQQQFLIDLDSASRSAALEDGDPWKMHWLLSHMRGLILERYSTEKEKQGCALIDKARLLVSEIVRQNEIRRRLEKEQIWGWVQEMERWLAAAFDEQEIANVLAQMLPKLGILWYYISMYTSNKSSDGEARLLAAMENGILITLPKEFERFSAQQLIPAELGENGTPRNLVVEPLYYREKALGFMVIDTTSLHQSNVVAMLDTLRGLLGSALNSVQLHQQTIAARKDAEQMNELKSQFLSQVSHELYTPISLIVSLSEDLLSDDFDEQGATPGSFRQELETIRITGQHLSYLVRDVMDLGRSQLGQLKLTWERIDLGEVLRSVAEVGQQLAQQKNLGWHTNLDPKLQFVFGDQTRLRQIVLNLLSNAFKFTTDGHVTLAAEVKGQEVVVSVHDTGLGVPLHEQTVIFDEFRQSERTAARGYGGMGLGLAITRRLVELHGGKIGVQSSGEDGSGAMFYFTLPIIDTRSERPIEIIGQAQPVLVLTGQVSSAEALSQGLVRQGYQVEVIDITQATWLVDIITLCPGVIVIDNSIGEDQPWKVFQTLKNHPTLYKIPILFFSVELEQNTGSFLPMEIISKPLGSQQMAAVLQEKALNYVPSKCATILIVDDDPDILEIYDKHIQAQLPAAKILSAKDGHEALELMRKTRPDLVLLDLMMPVLDGFGVLETMQAHDSLRNIPVIILTSISLTNDILERLSLGVTKVLQKGIYSLDETLIQMDAVLSKSQCLGSGPQRIARRVMVYLHEHYAEPVSRRDIGSSIGVNETYLTRCFRQEMGLTPMDYLNRYRINQAKKLLEQRHRKITDVGLSLGFSSSSQFSRVFRRETGITPREYQQGKHSERK